MKFGEVKEQPSSLIVIAVKNLKALEKAYHYLSSEGVRLEKFWEPDWDYGFTAFASEPIPMEKRNIFKKYQLFKGDRHAKL